MSSTIGDKSLARDLCHLQINTILKDNIVGNDMPAIRLALCRLSDRYGEKLVELGEQADKVFAPQTSPGGQNRFALYHELALAMLTDGKKKHPQSERNMLLRVQHNSERLINILSADKNELSEQAIKARLSDNPRSGDLDLDHADYVAIRKMWELGTEEIVMQTTIDIDGDVNTRIKPDYAGNDFSIIHQLHGQSVDMSYRYWQSMITMVADVFKSLFDNILFKSKQ